MGPYDERRPGFQLPGRNNPWLLPVLIGIALGALLFGLLPEMLEEFGDLHERKDRAGMYAPSERQQPQAQDAPATREQDQPRFGRDDDDQEWRHGGMFFPFSPGRFVIPLLLMGAGAWLLSGRRRPGGWNGPSGRRTGPYGPPATPAPHEPYSNDPELPTTGETRRL